MAIPSDRCDYWTSLQPRTEVVFDPVFALVTVLDDVGSPIMTPPSRTQPPPRRWEGPALSY